MTKGPWFEDRGTGVLFAMPITLIGWLALIGMVLLLLATAWLPKSTAVPARIVIVIAYLALSFFKTERV